MPVGLRPPWVYTSHSPHSGLNLASIATTMHCAPNSRAPSAIRSGLSTAAVLMPILSAPARSSRFMSSTCATPPPTVNGIVTFSAVRRTTSTIVAALPRSGDVEEHQLVRPFPVVQRRQLHRIAGVAQIDEIDAFHDPAVFHVQARDDPFRQHDGSFPHRPVRLAVLPLIRPDRASHCTLSIRGLLPRLSRAVAATRTIFNLRSGHRRLGR